MTDDKLPKNIQKDSKKSNRIVLAAAILFSIAVLGIAVFMLWPNTSETQSAKGEKTRAIQEASAVPVYTDITVPGWVDSDLPIKVRVYKAGSSAYDEYEIKPTDTGMMVKLVAGSYEVYAFAPIIKDGTVFKPLEKKTFTIEEGKDKYTLRLVFAAALKSDITNALIDEVIAPWSVAQREEMRSYLIVATEGQNGQTATGNGSGTEDPSGSQGGSGGNGESSGGGSSGGGSTGLVWHPPWTEEIYHPAVIETVWHPAEGHYADVCSTCGAILGPGMAVSHLKEFGHSGYRGDVWIETSPAWSEAVVIKEAWTEYINHPGYWG